MHRELIDSNTFVEVNLISKVYLFLLSIYILTFYQFT
jgi:hypothetical protein